MITISDWLAEAEKKLHAKSTSPRYDCQYLACDVLEKPLSYLYAHPEYTPNGEQLLTLNHMLTRRLNGEPIAYITGRQGFWTFDLKVTPATLIPRPETECLVDAALLAIKDTPTPKILDLGTGSGAIALALATELKDSRVTASDVSCDALACAKANAQRLAITNITFLQSCWFDTLPAQQFDLIIANPPYIDNRAFELTQGDLRFEPSSALISDDQGYRDLLHIIAHAPAFLKPDGLLMLEHGCAQQETLMDAMTDGGYREVQGYTDLAQHPRFTQAKRP